MLDGVKDSGSNKIIRSILISQLAFFFLFFWTSVAVTGVR